MKFRYALALWLAAAGMAQAQEPAVPKGWNSAELQAAKLGCTLAIVGPQRKAFLLKAQEQGRTDALQEWEAAEPVLNREFGQTCSCVLNQIAGNMSLEQFKRDQQGAVGKAMAELLKPQGKCAIDLERLKQSFTQARRDWQIRKLTQGTGPGPVAK